MSDNMRRTGWVQGVLPAVGPASWVDVLRASIGAGLGLAIAGLFMAPFVDLQTGLYLIAPFGASAVLIFGVPSSPLAQPWSAVTGNTVAALVGVLVCMMVPDPGLRVALAVGGGVAAMLLARALHPPGGAVAMTAALSPEAVRELGLWFALAPVAVGTVALVATGVVHARLTGRHYPMRHSGAPADPVPSARIGLNESELEAILRNYRQSLNLGTEDLARLIGAAEMQVASHRSGDLTAAEIMSRDLVTVTRDTPLADVADLFRIHGFTTLPVVEGADTYLGVIFQIHLIRRARRDALHLDRGFMRSMRRLVGRRGAPVRAGAIMATSTPCATPATPVAALLPMMADGVCDAVPVLEDGRITGIVTRTDMIAALARRSIRAQA